MHFESVLLRQMELREVEHVVRFSYYLRMVGRPIADGETLCPFGRYLVSLCEAKNFRLFSYVDVVGSKSTLSRSLRGATAAPGQRRLLSFDELQAIAARVKANRMQTRKLIFLGLLEHAPLELRSCIAKMIIENFDQAERLNVKPSNLDFSGIVPDLLDSYFA